MAAVYVWLGRIDEAHAEIVELLKKEPHYTLETAKLWPYKGMNNIQFYLDNVHALNINKFPNRLG